MTTVTARFSQKIQRQQYEPTEASIEVSMDVEGTDTDAIEKVATDLFATAKAQVYAELQMPCSYDSELGIIVADAVEVVTQAFPGATTTAGGVPAGATNLGDVAAGPPDAVDERGNSVTGNDAPNRAWAKQRFLTNPEEFYDNRGNKRNPKGPDIKHKASNVAAWLS